jgi:hypothetical protein
MCSDIPYRIFMYTANNHTVFRKPMKIVFRVLCCNPLAWLFNSTVVASIIAVSIKRYLKSAWREAGC